MAFHVLKRMRFSWGPEKSFAEETSYTGRLAAILQLRDRCSSYLSSSTERKRTSSASNLRKNSLASNYCYGGIRAINSEMLTEIECQALQFRDIIPSSVQPRTSFYSQRLFSFNAATYSTSLIIRSAAFLPIHHVATSRCFALHSLSLPEWPRQK